MKRMTIALGWVLSAALMTWTPLSAAAETHYRLEIDGLACPFCEYGIEKNLFKIEGVEEVETNLKEGTVTVRVADGHAVSEERFRRAITDAGFTLTSVEPHKMESTE